MNFKVISRANTSVITVSDLKNQIGLFGDDSYDLELASTIEAAQDLVEDQCGVFLRDAVIVQPLSGFNDHDFPHKVISNVSVSYFDADNASQATANTAYILDETGVYPRISFTEQPVTSNDYTYPVQVQYTATNSDVPARVKHAVLVAGTELFEVRGESTEKSRAKVQLTISRLLGSFKRVVV